MDAALISAAGSQGLSRVMAGNCDVTVALFLLGLLLLIHAFRALSQEDDSPEERRW